MKNLLIIGASLLLFGHGDVAATDNCKAEALANIGSTIVEADQSKRIEHIRLSENTNKTAEQTRALLILENQIREMDKHNQETVLDLVQRCGIPKGKLMTNPFLDAALVVSLHAPLEYERIIYPFLQIAVEAGDLPQSTLEKLTRRMQYWQKLNP